MPLELPLCSGCELPGSGPSEVEVLLRKAWERMPIDHLSVKTRPHPTGARRCQNPVNGVFSSANFSNNNVVGALKIKHSVPTGNICLVPCAAPYTSVKPDLVSILGRVFGSGRDYCHTASISKR